jgi:hypothetical protein
MGNGYIDPYLLELDTSWRRIRDNTGGIATGYELDDGGFGVRVHIGSKFSPLYFVQTGSEVHPTSYPMDNGDNFPGGKAAEASI